MYTENITTLREDETEDRLYKDFATQTAKTFVVIKADI